MTQITESGRHVGISTTLKGNTYLIQYQNYYSKVGGHIIQIVEIWDEGSMDNNLKTSKNISS